MTIAERLRKEGYKATPQRIAVYQCIDGRAEHPTAEQIYHELKAEHPTMSLATVYKTMDIFEKIGLIRVLRFDRESSHYDYDTLPHAHILCTVCNRIDDVDGVDLEQVDQLVELQTGYKLTGDEILFRGICASCQKKIKEAECSRDISA